MKEFIHNLYHDIFDPIIMFSLSKLLIPCGLVFIKEQESIFMSGIFVLLFLLFVPIVVFLDVIAFLFYLVTYPFYKLHMSAKDFLNWGSKWVK